MVWKQVEPRGILFLMFSNFWHIHLRDVSCSEPLCVIPKSTLSGRHHMLGLSHLKPPHWHLPRISQLLLILLTSSYWEHFRAIGTTARNILEMTPSALFCQQALSSASSQHFPTIWVLPSGVVLPILWADHRSQCWHLAWSPLPVWWGRSSRLHRPQVPSLPWP